MRGKVRRARAYVTGEGLGPFLVRAVAGTSAVQMASMLAGFLVGVQLARGLGARGYGYYGIALSVVTIAGLPAELGLSNLLVREVAAAKAAANLGRIHAILHWAKRIAVAFSAASVLLVAAGSMTLGYFRPSPLVLALFAGAPAIAFMALARINSGALQGLEQVVRGQLLVNLVPPAGMSLLLLGIWLFGIGLQPANAMLVYSVSVAVAWSLSAFWLSQRLPHSESDLAPEQRRSWLSSMIPLALSGGLFTLQGQLSMLLMGFLTSPANVGLFRIAAVTASILAAPQTIIFAVSVPVISRLHAQGDKVKLQKLLTRAAQAQFSGVLLLSLPLFLAPERILEIVFGHQYGAAANALEIMLAGQLASAALGLNTSVLNMTHHERPVTRATAVALVVGSGAIFAFAPRWGPIGGAIGYTLATLTLNIMTWIDALRLVQVDTSVNPMPSPNAADKHR